MNAHANTASIESSLDRVEKLRDRFALLGSAFAVVCVLVAIWVRAPSLEIEIPLAEAKGSLNVGYVLALGVPAITVVYAWISGTLVSMRRYQAEILRRLHVVGAEERRLVMLRLRDCSEPGSPRPSAVERSAGILTSVAHVLVLFVIPSAACLWIAVAYFTRLEVYPEHNLDPCWHLAQTNPAASKAGECRRDVTAGEHILGRTLSHWIFHTPAARDTDRFAIANGDWEKVCQDIWKREAGDPDKTEAPSREKCVLDQFPHMVLPVNTYVNVAGLALTLLLGIFGFRAQTRLPKVPP